MTHIFRHSRRRRAATSQCDSSDSVSRYVICDKVDVCERDRSLVRRTAREVYRVAFGSLTTEVAVLLLESAAVDYRYALPVSAHYMIHVLVQFADLPAILQGHHIIAV